MRKTILAAAIATMFSVAPMEAVAVRLDATEIQSSSGAFIIPSKKARQPVKQPTLAMEFLQPDVLMPADQAREVQAAQPASTAERLIVTTRNLLLRAWEFVTLE